MRTLVFLAVCAAVVFVSDLFIFKSGYSDSIWRDMQYEGRKFEYEVRRWIVDQRAFR
jgi:hypothetical protein